MVVHMFIPGTLEAEAGNLCVFKANLIYIVKSVSLCSE